MKRTSTKDNYEREQEETERLIRKAPKHKPPRHDKRREIVDSEKDPDLDQTDKDLSQNYKVIGGSSKSTYSFDRSMDRHAIYLGQAPNPVKPYPEYDFTTISDITASDTDSVMKSARELLSSEYCSVKRWGDFSDARYRAALDIAIRTQGYDRKIHPRVYDNLLSRLAGASKSAKDTSMSNTVQIKTASLDSVLEGMDKLAGWIQANYKALGLTQDGAKKIVNHTDRMADELEAATYGGGSLLTRQAGVLGFDRSAEVIERDADEGYVDSFENPQEPIQTDSDEPYMNQYDVDQSSGVHHGKSTVGRPLAP